MGEKNCMPQTSDSRLICRTHKEHRKLNKNSNNPIDKWENERNKQQNKYINFSFNLISVSMAVIKKTKNNKFGQMCEQNGPLTHF